MSNIGNRIPENYSNLKKYYKQVIICFICEKPYGVDVTEGNHACPDCILENKRRLKDE